MTLGKYEFHQCANCHRSSGGEQYCARCEALAEQEEDVELDEEEQLAVVDHPVSESVAGVKTAISYPAPTADQREIAQ